MLANVGNSILHGLDGIGILVGNLNTKLLLDGHNSLDNVEAVQTKVLGEGSVCRNLFIRPSRNCFLPWRGLKPCRKTAAPAKCAAAR